MKIKTKKRKKWRYVHRKFGIIQRFNTEDTKERSLIRLMEVSKVIIERHYAGSNVLFLDSTAHSLSLQISISFFIIYGGSKI